MVLEQLDSHLKNRNLKLIIFIKICSKQIMDLNVEHKTVNLLKDNLGGNLDDHGNDHGNDDALLNVTPRHNP